MGIVDIIQCSHCQTYEEGEPVFGVGEFILFSDIPAERRPKRQCPQCRANLSDWDWIALDPTDITTIFRPQAANSPLKVSAGHALHLDVLGNPAKPIRTKQRQEIGADLGVF